MAAGVRYVMRICFKVSRKYCTSRQRFTHLNTVPFPYCNKMTQIPILFQNEDFLVVDKPFDLKINSDDPEEVTLGTILRSQTPELVDGTVAHGFRYAHRLDYATSGVLCLALNQKSAHLAGDAFRKGQVTKHYLALVRGHLEAAGAIKIEAPIGKDSSINDRCIMCTPDNVNCHKPRYACSTIHVLEQGKYDGEPATKILLIPETGRTHQLRVHCDHVGHTIVGDYTYSYRQDTKPPRMMLHAHRLRLTPGGDRIDVTTPDPFLSETDALWTVNSVNATYDQIINT